MTVEFAYDGIDPNRVYDSRTVCDALHVSRERRAELQRLLLDDATAIQNGRTVIAPAASHLAALRTMEKSEKPDENGCAR